MYAKVLVSTVLKFTYEGQEHVIRGVAKYNMLAKRRIFNKIGKLVPIYYSPKYDEVVFIKENS